MCSANGASGKSIENGERRVMEYRRLEDEEYLRRLKVVITGSEGLSTTVENIGDGKATIGYGYTFNRSDNAAIWREAGITLSEQDRRLLATVDAAADGDRTRLALGFSKSMSGAEGDDLFRATVRRYNGPADSLDMPNSDERIALVSLAYNRGVGNVSNHPVMQAIRDGDRAEAWFQIRYNCWGSDSLDHQYPDRLSNEGGLRKRRFAEAEPLLQAAHAVPKSIRRALTRVGAQDIRGEGNRPVRESRQRVVIHHEFSHSVTLVSQKKLIPRIAA